MLLFIHGGFQRAEKRPSVDAGLTNMANRMTQEGPEEPSNELAREET